MTQIRRVHHQPPRDDYLVDDQLGLATVRTDLPGGRATFAVMEEVQGLRGLHLNTGITIARTPAPSPNPARPGARFTVDGASHRTLTAALVAVHHTLSDLTAFAA